MKENKKLILYLSFYVIFQIASLYFGFPFVAYLLVYIIAVIVSSIRLVSEIKRNNAIKSFLTQLLLFFIANLSLFLIFVPTIIYNPDINWKLKGGIEVDPMFLYVYIPPIFFSFSLLVLLITLTLTKITRRYWMIRNV
jgi:hypothetical protein